MAMLQLLESDPARYRLEPGMKMLVGGAPVPEALIRAFARHGAEIRQGWGMTETSPVGSIAYLKPELQGASEDERFRRFASAGVPVPLMDIRLAGDDGAETPWDGASVGEIQVRGPFITGSYHDVPADAEKFTSDGWLRTGDVAAIDPEGYVQITDRTKDLIKSGGEWISSVDLETTIMDHPKVLEAAVIAVPHERWVERPLACIVPKPEFRNALTAEEIYEYLTPRVAKWWLPDGVIFIDAVPKTSVGKFDKKVLRERFKTWQPK